MGVRHRGEGDTLSAPLLTSLLAREGREAVLAGDGRRDWLYARDVSEALAGLLAAPAPSHALYNVASGQVWDAAEWCQKLRRRHPPFAWRAAREGEAGNVELYGSTARAPMAPARLREETGFTARFGLEEAFADYMKWMDAHPGV